MHDDISDLASLGWSTHFQKQCIEVDDAGLKPARVVAVHRNGLDVIGVGLEDRIVPLAGDDPLNQATVGDWLLLDAATRRPRRLLKRTSLFKRRAAGTGRAVQLIAANVDVLFIVSSCNQDFNIARLERYLALARDADCMPVIVLTKADQSDDAERFARDARTALRGVLVECVNALDPASVSSLQAWCGRGQTIALVGSSGVGKSTLANTLMGAETQATGAIREDDARGRHTTTARALLRLPTGGWLLDTPGMRELQLADVQDGVEAVFADIVELAAQCRFSDCRHEAEPGCAVQAAIESGVLDASRLARMRKLEAESRFNTETLAESRARSRAFGKMVRRVMQEKKNRF